MTIQNGYSIIEKRIGQTPLQAIEKFRENERLPADVPLAYAGRLDPMASGKLLVLIGEECKNQTEYHSLDKEYEFAVLFGAKSDTGDALGLISYPPSPRVTLGLGVREINSVCESLMGDIELPYPHFSSKTVRGKPLHVWAIEGRLDEIEIPTKKSTIYELACTGMTEIGADELYEHVSEKIELIPTVTEESKKLGNDFRRPEVRASWKAFHEARTQERYQIAHFTCTASSGTYMRTLAAIIGKELGTCGLAYMIHRSKIGTYKNLPFGFGFWSKKY